MHLRTIRNILLLVSCFSSTYLLSETKITDNLYLGINYQKGYCIAEYQVFNYIVNDYFRSVDITLTKSTYGKDYWQQIYNYPHFGISFYHSTLGNNQILGKEYALTAFARFDILKISKFSLYNRTGIGLSYVTKKFDIENNYLDVAVGSHINTHVNLRLGIGYQPVKKLELKSGVSFDHFSNANMSEPNLGVNALTFFAGANYLLGIENEKVTHTIEPLERKFYFDLYTSLGGKHTRRLTSEVFFCSSMSLESYYMVLRKLHIGLGADLFFDSSIKDQLTDRGDNYKAADSFQSGIHISQSFIYNKFAIELQEGIYLLLPEKVDGYKFYNRGIVKYRVSRVISIRMAMKTHLHILDYPEVGLGIRLD